MTPALKEWAIAIDALTSGKMILLLRKGGIREVNGKFQVAHQRVWLYPTYEHQQPQWLKPPYNQQIQSVPSGWHPTPVRLTSWADITHIFATTDPAAVPALLPFHVWNESFVLEKLRWKPRQPLYLLLLRVHQLQTPYTVPYQADYGGCRSWIDLTPDRPTALAFDQDPTYPVLTDGEYADRVKAIATLTASWESQAESSNQSPPPDSSATPR
ncbi:MAG: DUF1802 family protein [Leptolyngbyaceae cyanobacterium SL_7_1]|nr:DUF1802 family protein [Leptolyngbyaceae cyanobacterium SL_7_1]